MPIIEVDHVTKEYNLGQLHSLKRSLANAAKRLRGGAPDIKAPFKALDDVSFAIDQGEVVGIIGHNGAGKSTLLKLLSRISTPTRGRIRVGGQVAPLIEVGAGLVGDMTGRENIYLNAAILGLSRAEVRSKFDEIVAFAELEAFVDTPVKKYSSGMAVRLGFAIATAVRAEILIVDEVLAVGDIAFQQKCIERMERLIHGEGRTVIIVGHNVRQLERICTRTLLLDHGRISRDGTPQEVCGVFFREAQERTFSRHTADGGDLIVPQESAGVIAVCKVRLLDGGGSPVEAVGMHEAVGIEVEFEVVRRLESPEIVVGLHTSDFVHVLSVSNVLPGVRPTLEPGVHRLTCTIRDLPLRPYSYSLRLAFLDRFRHMLWYGENIMKILVEAGRIDITKIPEVGFVETPADWVFDMPGHRLAAGGAVAERLA